MLQPGQIEEGRRRRREQAELDVCGDADDLGPGSVRPDETNPLAERILARPVAGRHAATDDRDARCVGRVGRLEPAPAHDRDAHGIEVVLVHACGRDREVVDARRQIERLRDDGRMTATSWFSGTNDVRATDVTRGIAAARSFSSR